MCSHHLIEPVACTPASGWEKCQVEDQVGNLRDQLFRPKARVKSLAERASFDEIAGKGMARRDEVCPLIASLIRAERTHRQA